MIKRSLSALVLSLALMLILTASVAPRTVEAVSCAPMAPGLPLFELLIRGRLAAIPERGVARISVSRYFKGSGPATLAAEVSGIGQGQREDWTAKPKIGDELVVALRREGTALRNTICNPFVILRPGEDTPKWVTDQFGQGVPPDPSATQPEPPARPVSRWWWLGGAAAIVLLLVLAARAIRRRAR